MCYENIKNGKKPDVRDIEQKITAMLDVSYVNLFTTVKGLRLEQKNRGKVKEALADLSKSIEIVRSVFRHQSFKERVYLTLRNLNEDEIQTLKSKLSFWRFAVFAFGVLQVAQIYVALL